MNRWYVIDDRMPQFLTTDQEFGILHNLIETIKPDVLIIDSLTHLCNGPIEDSTVCSKLMKRVRGLAKGRNCTPIVIHHIPKINDAPLTIHSVAGSRVVGQEVDFVIGINSLSNGKKYLKMVKSRYVRDTTEVISFTIDDDCWLKMEGKMDELQILATVDGRFDFNNKEKIFDFIVEELENGNDDVEFSQIKEKLVDTQEMSLQTAHTQLNSLIKEKRIIKGGHGRYKLPD